MELRIPAIEIRQGPDRVVYTFGIDGKIATRIATVSRLRRVDGELQGYQRVESFRHIEQIREYIETAGALMPNAVVIAFDDRAFFKPSDGPMTPYSRVGELVIAFEDDLPPEALPGLIVDGQQRLTAIRDAAVTSFPIAACAFIASDERVQREQFILVNSTKPLDKALLYELIGSTDSRLPEALERRRVPAQLLAVLNSAEASPFKERIRTATNPTGLIKDTAMLSMIENSVSNGALYRINSEKERLEVLYRFWRAVARTWPAAWDLPPKRSRLTHGAGIVSLGLIMDAVSERFRHKGNGAGAAPAEADFEKDLAALVPHCAWTAGYWDFGPGRRREWREIQNTSRDVSLLSQHLCALYKGLVWTEARPFVSRPAHASSASC